MKRVVVIMAVAVVLIMAMLSCSKKETPTTPAATATPNATATAVAGLSYTSFAYVPGGTFTQTDGTKSFTHTISPFYMGQYEVTYELWYEVYRWAINNGYAFANAGTEGNDGTSGAAPITYYEPVTEINWRDCIVWCNAYSEMTGLTPVYYSDAEYTTPIKDSTDGDYGGSINVAAGSFDNPYVKWDANGYRLPTEGEWEYAARYVNGSAWTPYNYASGATADYTDAIATSRVAWYADNASNVTHNVGEKDKNALNIYDMSGNVWERCWDWSGDYPQEASANYKGPASGDVRIGRGGSYINGAVELQTGERGPGAQPYMEAKTLGFRLARTKE